MSLSASTADPTPTINFIDLGAQQQAIRPQIEAALRQVLDHGQYIMGPEVRALEEELSAFTGARHTISCASGTDALLMILMAQGVGVGDAVLCPSFTFPATPEVVALLGASPVFVDVCEETFNIDPSSITSGCAAARAAGLTPKAVIAVDLFGQPADYDAVHEAASKEGIWVLADAAQSLGASITGKRVGTFGLATATSFFPAKPLGCYGDGGAIFTDDDAIAERLRSIRVHGKGTSKYDNVRIGINGRLDTIQAAILLEKIKIFPQEIKQRSQVAETYTACLSSIDGVSCPNILPNTSSVWAQYTVRVASHERGTIIEALQDRGVPTAVYYPKPTHEQQAFSGFPVQDSRLPASSRLSDEVLSLPMHPYLDSSSLDYICQCLIDVLT